MKQKFARGAAIVGGLAVVGGVMAACSTDTKTEPEKTTGQSSVAPSSSAAPSPTEKGISPITPGHSGNSFSPQVTAKPAPTALPGNVVTGN